MQIVGFKRDASIKKSNPTEELTDEKLISRAVWECLRDGDLEGVVEVIEAYVEALKKIKKPRNNSLSRATCEKLKPM